jgi:ankyrin repeat protein
LSYGLEIAALDYEDRTPLALAARKKSVTALVVLLERSPSELVNQHGHHGRTPLQEALLGFDEDIPSVRRCVAILLEANADPTLVDEEGRSALDYARALGAEDIIEMITERPTRRR